MGQQNQKSNNIEWHHLRTEECLSLLHTSRQGLSQDEARKRLEQYGKNELKHEKRASHLEVFFSQFKSFLVVILIIATILSFLVGQTLNAVAILVIVLLNAILGYIQEFKAEKTIEALQKLTQQECRVIRAGREQKVWARHLVPGDIIILEEGNRVAADMRLLEVTELKIDESVLTGESIPISKRIEVIDAENLADQKNMIWAGSMVSYGRGIGVVTGTAMDTEIGKIAHLVSSKNGSATPLQYKLNKLGRKLGILVVVISLVVVLMGILRQSLFMDLPLNQEFVITLVITGIALAVAAIPEGLPAVVTITLAMGLQKLAKKNALMRRLPAVEALGSTTVICSDKTGTLTQNQMTVTDIWIPDLEIKVCGKGYYPEGDFMIDNKKIKTSDYPSLAVLLQGAMLCNNARLENKANQWSILGDPTEGALIVLANKAGYEFDTLTQQHPRLRELPFSSEKKTMYTVNQLSDGRAMIYAKGAPEAILERCKYLDDGQSRIELTPELKNKILNKNKEFASRALRVLALASREITRDQVEDEIESDLVFHGMLGMIDPPHETVAHDIALCKKAGIKVIMITGDNKDTALAIAKQVGIVNGERVALTGAEVESMSVEELARQVNQVSVFARINPEYKLKIVEALRQNGHIIAMTGDGVNDAPALKGADIGVAMGINGSDVAREAGDMILRDDNFSSIVGAVAEGRGIYDNIKKFTQYMLSSNFAEVLIVFFAMLIGFTDPSTGLMILPLYAIHLLWINLLTDGLPALALGVDTHSADIMDRPPRDPDESIISNEVVLDILVIGSAICIATLYLFWSALDQGIVMATTMAFTSLVVFEMVKVYAVRLHYGVSMFSNWKLFAAVGISLTLQMAAIYIPFMQRAFGTTGLGLWDWGRILIAILALALLMWGVSCCKFAKKSYACDLATSKD